MKKNNYKVNTLRYVLEMCLFFSITFLRFQLKLFYNQTPSCTVSISMKCKHKTCKSLNKELKICVRNICVLSNKFYKKKFWVNKYFIQEVSIWVLEKKLLTEKYSKQDKELILNVFKQGCSQLVKLKHPRILTVEHVLEESRFELFYVKFVGFASYSYF